jgi:hypothetical protein
MSSASCTRQQRGISQLDQSDLIIFRSSKKNYFSPSSIDTNTTGNKKQLIDHGKGKSALAGEEEHCPVLSSSCV